jgi:hypothetical protein
MNMALAKFGIFWGNFGGFSGCLEGLVTYL